MVLQGPGIALTQEEITTALARSKDETYLVELQDKVTTGPERCCGRGKWGASGV